MFNGTDVVKWDLVAHGSGGYFTGVSDFSCMYFRKVRLDYQPNFIISVSVFLNILSSIEPPSWRDFVSTICAMMPCFSIPRSQTDTLTVLLIYRGCIPDFVSLVYTTAMLSSFIPPLVRMWCTSSASALTGKGFPLVRASW